MARSVRFDPLLETGNPFTPCIRSRKGDQMERQSRFLGTADVARLLGVDPSTVKRWSDAGRLPCCKTVGGHRRFTTGQVEQFIAAYHLEAIALSGATVPASSKATLS